MSEDKSKKMVLDLCNSLKNAVVITEENLSPEARQELQNCTPNVGEREEHISFSLLETWHADRCKELLQVENDVFCVC